ncbi:MAG: efflux RND transporter permease subunit [Deltaproteobacteria bacterium]|nr:efflux RND transporter permease subunit [Deltaproteobacteria bacterium]
MDDSNKELNDSSNDVPKTSGDDVKDTTSIESSSVSASEHHVHHEGEAFTEEEIDDLEGFNDLRHDKSPLTGPIAWMTRNSVAANLLMFIVLVGGALGLSNTKQEVFPEFDLDLVNVTVPYPGASPADVEQGIVLVLEEAMSTVDGVKRITSASQENAALVSAELTLEADPDRVLNDIKSAVDRIQTFPEEAESPTVALASRRRQVMDVVIAGDQSLKTLHGIAEQVREGLLDQDGISQVEIAGVPPLEVNIDVSRQMAETHGLPPHVVAQQVKASSLERPAGELETSSGEISIRVSQRKRTVDEFEDVILQSTNTGARVAVSDIATVTDGYQDIDESSKFDGHNAVQVIVYRAGTETPTSVSDITQDFVKDYQKTLPPGVNVKILHDDSEGLRSRIDLLLNNAWMGLILVLIILALFLDVRLAVWVSLGIPISFLGAFLLLPNFGMSVNMVSLFAFIVTLGMVVDDAIIVGEHAFHLIETGVERERAAIVATKQMSVPVTFAVLTSITAFSPMLMVPGMLGKIFRVIPMVVIAVLIFSVVESFFILPSHVAHIGNEKPGLLRRPFDWARSHVAVGFSWFTNRMYRPSVKTAIKWRTLTLGIASTMLLLTFGGVLSGKIPFSFFPNLPGDRVVATVRLPYGAPESLTQDAAKKLEVAAEKALTYFGGEDGSRGMLTMLGSSTKAPGEKGSHLVSVTVNLVPNEERQFSAVSFEEYWEKQMETIVGAESITFSSATGPGGGSAVDVQLSHRDVKVLAAASARMTDELRKFSELRNIQNSYSAGKPQLDFVLRDQARNLGFTSADVANQLRSSFFGAEVLREQRGRNEVRVMVRVKDGERNSEYDLEDLRIRSPQGDFVPLSDVATFTRGTAPTVIRREDGRRTVNVSGELNAGVKSSKPVIDSITDDILPGLLKNFPGLEAGFVGQKRSQQESFQSLGKNFIFALFVIYVLLAIPFRSYTQPMIVMFAIPLGIVGAVLGHVVMGYSMSLISIFGVIALSGVVVNDSLVLIDATNGYVKKGLSLEEAVIEGGVRRLRPIILTSLTTFFGLMPMIFEESLQARFLIPMAISLGFGVLFATFVALLVVPSLFIIIEKDLRDLQTELGQIFKAVKGVFIPVSMGLFMVSFALFGTGCEDPEAPGKCEAIAESYCAVIGEECPVDEEDCLEAFAEEIDCDEAVGVADEYVACQAAVDTMQDCPTDLPSSCKGVVYFPVDNDE